jgi:ABC-2 type transport system ATP-binding protein
MSDRTVVVEVQNLKKTFVFGLLRKKVHAVKQVSFQVMQGDMFGLLGPNGSGKTTTLRMILKLIFPSEGEIRILGTTEHNREVAKKIGFLPENPYIYQYLKPREFLDLCGRLVGMPRGQIRQRSEEMIDKVGLRHAVDRPIGKFSKGMMQRMGIAQALLHDPPILILDEPMSGLDPIGRKEIRELLQEQHRLGKTLIFTSHILTDVERLCERVAIIHQGEISAYGRMDELLQNQTLEDLFVRKGVRSLES